MEALNSKEYTELRYKKYVQQDGRCADCGEAFSINQLELHHAIGRGVGGSAREDLDPRNRMICKKCHPGADRHRESKFKAIPDET